MRLGFSQLAFVSLLAAPLGLACGDSASGDGNGDEVGTGTGDESADEGNDTEAENDYAHGVRIAGVTFNQGTSVPIANGTAWAGPTERLTRVVRDRDGIVRVFVIPSEGAEEHEIECRLTLTHSDESTQELTSTLVLGAGPSNIQDLTTTCNFELKADEGHVQVGTEFQVSLHEPGASDGGDLPSESAVVSPADGPGLIGVEDADRTMKVKMYPCTFEGETPPVNNEYDMQVQALIEQLPAQSVDVQVQNPIDVANPALSYILIVMGTERANDGEPTDTYYYGWSVDTDNGGAGGLAMFGSFVAAGAWIGSGLYRRQTFVHELGHDQAMNHIECESGVEQMPPFAEDYPNEIGIIELPGYGIESGELHDGAFTYNYMSYCGLGGQTWTNSWNWNKSWERMDYVEAQSQLVAPRPPVLRGIVGDDGVEGYWTTRAKIDPERVTGNHIFRFTSADGEVVELPGEWVPAGEGTSMQLTVELPEGFDLESGTIERVSFGTNFPVALPADRRIHQKFDRDIFFDEAARG